MARRNTLALALALALPSASAIPAIGRASPVDAQLQAARELFQQAEQDEDAGRWSDALAELRRVADVKLTAGVRYHVALCEEHLGQIATALADYNTAETQAEGEGAQDVLRLVGKRIKDLEPRVPRLTIHIVPALPDAEVKLDGVVVAKALVGIRMPVDPGVHRVEATARDRATTSTAVTLEERDNAVLEVNLSPTATSPALSATATRSKPKAGLGPPRSYGLGSKTSALIASGATVLLAAGGVFAFVEGGNALTNGERQCASLVGSQPDPCGPERAAVRAWDYGAAALWVGAAALGTVSVLLWTSHDRGSSSAWIIGPGSLALRGAF